jgi:hypothetical protein
VPVFEPSVVVVDPEQANVQLPLNGVRDGSVTVPRFRVSYCEHIGIRTRFKSTVSDGVDSGGDDLSMLVCDSGCSSFGIHPDALIHDRSVTDDKGLAREDYSMR